MVQPLVILSIALIFAAFVEVGLAIVVIALYRKVETSGLIEARIDALEGAYRNLRAAKANAARGAPTKNQPMTGFPGLDAALADLTPEERSLFS